MAEPVFLIVTVAARTAPPAFGPDSSFPLTEMLGAHVGGTRTAAFQNCAIDNSAPTDRSDDATCTRRLARRPMRIRPSRPTASAAAKQRIAAVAQMASLES